MEQNLNEELGRGNLAFEGVCKKHPVRKLVYAGDLNGKDVYLCPVCNKILELKGNIKREKTISREQIITFKEQIETLREKIKATTIASKERILGYKRAIIIIERNPEDFFEKEVKSRIELEKEFRKEHPELPFLFYKFYSNSSN